MTPRGSIYESDTIFQLDFSLAFDLGSAGIIKESSFKVDIFNILGQDGVDDTYEFGESGDLALILINIINCLHLSVSKIY